MVAADLIRRGYRIAIPYAMIEWLAVYDATTKRCYYVPATELGEGMKTMHLRLVATRNNQTRRVRFASSYLEI